MSWAREARVGAFVLAGLFAIGAVVFLIGDEHGIFSPKHEYGAVFEDVQGLKQGSPVRMGGVDVGSVKDVAYGDDPKDPKLYVRFTVARDAASRIREDSVATIEGKGMLGDKMIVITIGSTARPEVPVGEAIKTAESKGLEEMMTRATAISIKAEKVMNNLETATQLFADEKVQKELRATSTAMSGILQKLNSGEGYAGRVLSDPEEAEKLSRLVTNLEQTSRELSDTMRQVNTAAARINQGPGFAHEVIYGEGPSKAMGQVGSAAEEVAVTLRGIREGNGPAKGLIYGDEGSEQLMSNLTAASGDFRRIMADIRAGKGTVGALLVDPSVYEDIKILLGNVERNRTLRALVRYSIRQDETAPGVEVVDPAPAKPTPATSSPASSGNGSARSP